MTSFFFFLPFFPINLTRFFIKSLFHFGIHCTTQLRCVCIQLNSCAVSCIFIFTCALLTYAAPIRLSVTDLPGHPAKAIWG
ncbi:uncharacterized protein F4812DRAFT_416726 [Daldinia caldariorum]|uniref:uncharacterized protein n=1 Tax=Daldinia caldariorum TaxID=326644 RepID=UPI002008A371|nr:uncharacterized protein F4812DRAFT_416726 [Daldinia caldariorum]KAI1470232.1 hypothetical protein F4812DRAFT_416726 [Daldinia caldariorum]